MDDDAYASYRRPDAPSEPVPVTPDEDPDAIYRRPR
jgi:hypothetical protein